MSLAALPDQSWIDDLGPIDGLETVTWDMTSPPARADEIGLVVPPYLSAETRVELLADLPKLQVVQLLSAGYDSVSPHLPAGVTLCNASGVHDTATAELALALTLAGVRGIPQFVEAQREGQWLPAQIWPSLADSKVLVVGYGHVGTAIVRRLLPFEVEVTAVASRARAGDDLVETVHGIDELPALLPDHQVVILIVPLLESTARLVDAGFLAAMPDGALLVNVARGGVVDTDALLAETRSGRLHAALDVTDPEPLPADHPLWHVPGVLISPHVGGATDAMRPRALRLLRAQLTAYASGQPLANVIDL